MSPAPVAIPTLASGHWRHHARTAIWSTVASLKPFLTRGCLPGEVHFRLPHAHCVPVARHS